MFAPLACAAVQPLSAGHTATSTMARVESRARRMIPHKRTVVVRLARSAMILAVVGGFLLVASHVASIRETRACQAACCG